MVCKLIASRVFLLLYESDKAMYAILQLIVIVLLWVLLMRFVPMPSLIMTIINLVVIIYAVLLLLQLIGVPTGINVPILIKR